MLYRISGGPIRQAAVTSRRKHLPLQIRSKEVIQIRSRRLWRFPAAPCFRAGHGFVDDNIPAQPAEKRSRYL